MPIDNESDVRGPVAIIVIVSFIKSSKNILLSLILSTFIESSYLLTTSLFITSILGWLFIISVTFLANSSLSTAKACPAGTAVSSAILIKS